MNTVFDRLFHAESVFEEYACYAEILHLISMTATDIPLKTAANLEAALNEIKTNHAKKLSVDHLAACCNMSASYFYSVFKKTLDITPLTYLNDYRLLRATALLLTTDLHIAEVAAAVGIEDASYFNRLFHHKYGTTPSAYRKSHRTLFAP